MTMTKKEYRRHYYLLNRERLLAYSKDYYENNNGKDKARESRRKDKVGTMVKAAKKRAKEKGLEFNLDKTKITIPKFCPVLGIELKPGTGSPPIDSAPTLDRKDNSKGYTMDNIEVISWRANKLKNDMTLEECKALLKYFAGIKGLDNNNDDD